MDDCIEWTGYRSKGGYGIYSRRINGKKIKAHRLSYCLSRAVPLASIKGLLVRHICDNPPCVNPSHLEVGSVRDNVLDSTLRGRHYYGSVIKCKQGHEYTESNTYVYPSGSRSCITCKREGVRKYRKRIKQNGITAQAT